MRSAHAQANMNTSHLLKVPENHIPAFYNRVRVDPSPEELQKPAQPKAKRKRAASQVGSQVVKPKKQSQPASSVDNSGTLDSDDIDLGNIDIFSQDGDVRTGVNPDALVLIKPHPMDDVDSQFAAITIDAPESMDTVSEQATSTSVLVGPQAATPTGFGKVPG